MTSWPTTEYRQLANVEGLKLIYWHESIYLCPCQTVQLWIRMSKPGSAQKQKCALHVQERVCKSSYTELMCMWIYLLITFSSCWQMKAHLIWNCSKWRNFKRPLDFIKGFCTHVHAHTFFWQVLLSCLHIPSGRVQATSLFFLCVCAAALWFVNSNFEKKINCANDANLAAALPAFCNFPITLSCMPCVRDGYASTLLRNTGKSVNYFAP